MALSLTTNINHTRIFFIKNKCAISLSSSLFTDRPKAQGDPQLISKSHAGSVQSQT